MSIYSWSPRLMASMVTELMTLLMPGAAAADHDARVCREGSPPLLLSKWE